MRVASATAVLLAILGAGSSARADVITEDHACLGRWVGRGKSTGFPEEWTVDLTLTRGPSGGRCGTIEYTNPVCGGTLEECTDVSGQIHTREHYSHADGHCAAAGRVILRCEGERLYFRWIGWETTDTLLHRPDNGGAPAPATPPATAAPRPVPTITPSDAPSSSSPSSSPPPKPARGCGSGCAVGSGPPPPAWALLLVVMVAVARRAARASQ